MYNNLPAPDLTAILTVKTRNGIIIQFDISEQMPLQPIETTKQ